MNLNRTAKNWRWWVVLPLAVLVFLWTVFVWLIEAINDLVGKVHQQSSEDFMRLTAWVFEGR